MASLLQYVDPARAFIHQLSWGTLLGAQIFESYIVTKLAYRHLPPRPFAELQRHLFPAYFQLQTYLAVTALVSSVPLSWSASSSSPTVAMSRGIFWLRAVPLALTSACALLNWKIYGPRTSEVMMKRFGKGEQGQRAMPEGKEADKQADEEHKAAVKKRFRFEHNMSIHINAIALVGTVISGLSIIA